MIHSRFAKGLRMVLPVVPVAATLLVGALHAHGPIVIPAVLPDGPPRPLVIVIDRPHLTFTPAPVAFGSVPVASAAVRAVEIANATGRTLDLALTAPPGLIVQPASLMLGGHQDATVTLTWTPPSAGDLAGDLVVAVSHVGAEGARLETVALTGTATEAGAASSATWQDFVDAQAAGTEPILPDFSYAGYRRSEVPIPDVAGPIFDVTAYGAVAGDGASDRDAIQAAIGAAEAAGGGVVLFPAGVFHLNTDAEEEAPIRVEASGIVLRGAGMDGAPVGTTLVMERHQKLTHPTLLYSAPFMVQLGLPVGTPTSHLATVVADARRETFEVIVDTAAALSVGQWVTLSFISARDEVFDFYLANQERPACSPEPPPGNCWTRGVQVKEHHRIAAIDGTRLTFDEPVHIDVELSILEAGESWRLLTYPHIADVGVEDLLFQGGWTQPFTHHTATGNCLMPGAEGECISHDSAWSAVEMRWVVDGWVRRVRFRDWNQALGLPDSSRCTVLGVEFEGNKGHFSVSTGGGTGNLIGLSEDLVGHHHGPSVGYGSAATVYWRFAYPGDTSFDAHSTSPYATLFDAVTGGLRYGRSGGPTKGMPHHLRHLVLWSFQHRGPGVSPIDFWTALPRPTYFVRPIIVGFRTGPESGGSVSFVAEDLELEELHEQIAEPHSLFEAQLALRLGELPAWLAAARDGGP